MTSRSTPSPEQLRELLDYVPKTGVLTWRPRTIGCRPGWWNKRYAGRPAGCLCPEGFIVLKIDDLSYLAHRVIWAMVHGVWPDCIMHRNRRRGDNRLKNLRNASRKVVQRNLPMLSTNTSGVRGVSWNRATGKWCASIRVDDVTISLGSYVTKEEAAKARRVGERRRDRSGF